MPNQFLLDINPNKELPNYDLVLTKLNEEQITSIRNIEDFEIKAYFANIDEISFRIPFYRLNNDGTQVKNEMYDLIDGSMMVLMNSMKYFILTKPEIKTDERTGKIYKDILGYSREYEFAQKKLIGYEGASRKIYDYNNDRDENGLEWGFFNFIEKNTSWRVGYINSNILTKFRHLSFPKATYLQAFQEVQKTFGCLFKYDTINKVINIYEVTQLGKNQGLYISDRNFINSLSQTINHDEIKTRLFLYGRDNISIQSINITGQPYIENFDFYKDTKYMSQGLIDALDDYEEYIATKDSIFSGYLAQLNTLNESLIDKKIELADLITQLKLIENTFDDAVSNGQPHQTIAQQQAAKIQEINNKQIEIDNVDSQLDVVYSNIENLSVDINLNNHLTEEQIKELDPFIREDEFNDGNYTEDNLDELLLEGKKLLGKISYPNLQFDVDVISFLDLVEAQHMWDKFVLGDLVTLTHEELGFDYEVRLVGYTHKPDDNKLSLVFSNRDSVDDANIYLKELLESLSTSASTVDFNRFKWDKGEEANFIINQYVDNALNLAKQQILKADGQRPMIDERGIWLIKENPDGSIENGQMRLIHNCLAITNDNWNTLEVAISAENGINANLIRGKLGQFAEVYANQIVVGSNGEKISNDLLDIDIDLDGVVREEELYNQVVITQERGIQVLDKASRERIRLGNYKVGKYGMVIKDKTGSTTVLDEDGILQTWQEGKSDNVGVNKPLNLYVYIPEQTNVIHKALLRFKREKFRAYSTSTISDAGVTKSTEDGGAFVESTMDGGGTTRPTTGGIDVDQGWEWTETPGEDHEHRYWHVTAHTHDVTIPAHSHYVNLEPHKHEIIIPPHKHDIEYGIYESTLPTDIMIKINDINYTTYLGAKNGVFNENREDLDITPLLKIGQWNTITLSSETLGRIDATVFLQAFIQTTRKSVILSDQYINTGTLGSGSSFGKSAITGRRMNIDSNVDLLYRVSINDGIAQVYYLSWTGQQSTWVNEFNLGSATVASIVLDGLWVRDEIEEKYKFQTEQYPYIFWVNGGELYVQKWKDISSKRTLASNVVNISSIRGWRNNSFMTHDQGVVCAYIKSDGKVYYRNYCMQANGSPSWENEVEVVEFTGTAKSISMYKTNDYRIGFVIEDTLNKTHILITSRNWAGMAIAPDHITVAPVEVSATLIPIEYPKAYEVEYLSVAPVEVTANLLFALTENEILSLANVPITKINENNEEYEDWGWAIEFKVENPIPSLTLANVIFTSVDTGISIGMASIEMIEENKYRVMVDGVVESGLNDIFGDIRLTISNVLNPAGYTYKTMVRDFTPINLVPTSIPLPEVEVIWNE